LATHDRTDILNPMSNVYNEFVEILKNVTIKYSYIAEANERGNAKQKGDEYLDSYYKRDNFLNYYDYLYEDYIAVGLTDSDIITEAMRGNNEIVPAQYREGLLNIRRQRVVDNYVEINNYYRMLNGYPDFVVDPNDDTKLATDENNRFYVDPFNVFYVPESVAEKYNVPNLYTDRVPIHLIQDYYNNIKENLGDDYISILEGSGYLDSLRAANPDIPYLKYTGSNRISLISAREAKNFQILQFPIGNIKYLVYHQFVQIYEQCRQYFMDVVFIRDFRSFIDNYDRFIAMCIMVMTLQQVVVKQLQLTVNREFFDIYAVRLLYQAYGVPYNLDLDEYTQTRICQNLNRFIQAKATDKGLYNIAEVLGFTNNFNIYKYFLSKEPKLDQYGVPIIKYKNVFNNDTGEVEVKPDSDAMYNIYFHREELKEDNFVNSFNIDLNNVPYDEITEADPFWIKDSNLNNMVYETAYNYVESKYLGVSISYKLTNLMYDNLMLLKTIIKKEDEIKELRVTLPKITGNMQVPIFDVIIAMICLTSCKHHLTGEILTLPTDIVSYLDYMTNIDAGDDYLVDTFSFNFEYLMEPDWEKSWWLNKKAVKVVPDDFVDFDPNKMAKYSDVQKKIPDVKLGDYVIDKMVRLYQLLSPSEVEEIKSYINILTIPDTYTAEEKQKAFNELMSDIKAFHKFIDYKITETKDRRVYRRLRALSRAIFYTKEVRDIFNINIDSTTRTAHNYFEYLYYKNPTLYNAMFETDTVEQYNDFVTKEGQYRRLIESYQLQYLRYYHIYCAEHGLSEDSFDIDTYKHTYTYWDFTSDINSQKLKPLTTKNYTLEDFDIDIERHYVTFYSENDISYDEFIEAANAGEFIDDNDFHYPVYIKYDYLSGTNVDNTDTRDEKVYFYLNHMISRLETVIDNIDYLYLLGDTTTPLQELLIKFIKFFKSYTTELISFDIILIVDLKNENLVKLYDLIHYIRKIIETREFIHLAYSDVVYAIINLYLKDKIPVYDRFMHYSDILFKDPINLTDKYDLYNYLKKILIPDKTLKLMDFVDYNVSYSVSDKPSTKHRLRDTALISYE